MKFIFYILAVLTLFLTSCSIKGDFKGLYSYYNKTKSEVPDIFFEPDSSVNVCGISNEDAAKVCVTNGKEIKKCLNQGKAVVYIWSAKCKSKLCYSPELLQQACDSKKVALFIVAEYYDAVAMNVHYNIQRPIYGIDVKYYRTNLTSEYIAKFLKDLSVDINTPDRALYFEDGLFVKSYADIWDIGN